VTIGRLIHGLEPVAALAAPRLQCETLEPAILERAAGAAVVSELQRRGHRVVETLRDAGVEHLIAAAGTSWHATAEPRLAGAAAVVA
jgi:gamma-glutamyltranspeptidase